MRGTSPNPHYSRPKSAPVGPGRACHTAGVVASRRTEAPTLAAAYQALTALVTPLDDADFARPTRCEGLPVGPLLVHLLFDAQRALMAFATPATPPADRDAVSYWRDFPGQKGSGRSTESDPSVRFVRQVAAAYAHPSSGLVRHWSDTAEAAARAAAAAPPDGFVATQGHVLAVPDFVATLVFEAAVHHLDLAVNLADPPTPTVAALDVVVRTLDGLIGSDPRAGTGWDDTTYALKGTGRLRLDDRETDVLGSFADRFPLIG